MINLRFFRSQSFQVTMQLPLVARCVNMRLSVTCQNGQRDKLKGEHSYQQQQRRGKKNESEIHCFELQRFIETRKQIAGSLTSSGIFVYCSINGIIYIPRVVSSQPGRLQPFLGYYFQSLASTYAFLSQTHNKQRPCKTMTQATNCRLPKTQQT